MIKLSVPRLERLDFIMAHDEMILNDTYSEETTLIVMFTIISYCQRSFTARLLLYIIYPPLRNTTVKFTICLISAALQ